MKGSVKQRSKGGTWTCRVDLPRGIDGKRKQISKGGFKTKKEAEAAMAETINKINKGDYLEPSTITVKEHFERWLADSVKNTNRITTFDNYKYLLHAHIFPEFGDFLLSKLQPFHIQRLYSKKLNDEGLSPTTVHRIHAVLHRGFATAVKWQLIDKNPLDAVEAPRPNQTQMKYMNSDQVRKLLDAVKDDSTYYTLYLTAVMTGLRRGELLALQWEDINLAESQASIRRSYSARYNGQLVLQKPKTSKGERNIALPSTVIRALIAHKKYQTKERLRLGQLYTDYGLVFCNEYGRPINPSNLRRHFKKTIEKSGLPVIRFHDLRHTHATLMLEQGVHPKIVSERLGHSKISVTLDTYSHALPNLQSEAAEKLDKALFAYKGDSSHTDAVKENQVLYLNFSTDTSNIAAAQLC